MIWPFSNKAGRLSKNARQAIVQAIGAAELGNQGEVRLHIERSCGVDTPIDRAREIFDATGMQETAAGTGVLLYVAIESRAACVYAGAGIHSETDEGFWQEVADEVAEGFSTQTPCDGLVSAIHKIGEILREHFPSEDEAGNELSNEVSVAQ